MNNDGFRDSVAEFNRIISDQAEQWRQVDRMLTDSQAEKRAEEKAWRMEMLEEVKQTNKILEGRLNAVNSTLDFILNSMGGNFQRIERMQLLTNKHIQEVAEILEEKDSHRLGEYIKEHGMEAFGTILNVLAFMSQK